MLHTKRNVALKVTQAHFSDSRVNISYRTGICTSGLWGIETWVYKLYTVKFCVWFTNVYLILECF